MSLETEKPYSKLPKEHIKIILFCDFFEIWIRIILVPTHIVFILVVHMQIVNIYFTHPG